MSRRTSARSNSRPTSPRNLAQAARLSTSGSTSARPCPTRPRTTDVLKVIDGTTPRLDGGGLGALVPQCLAGRVRRGEDFDAAEDALQEALVEALRVWPDHPPRDPRAWLAAGAAPRGPPRP